MLLSYSRNFIFLANVKTASRSVEQSISPYAEIAITETRLGKHATLEKVVARYKWLFRQMPLSDFFIFGVMRDPVSKMRSLYNFHHGPSFKNKNHSTFGIPFDEFVDHWLANSWQTRQQCEIFKVDGENRADAVLRFENLKDDFKAVTPHLRLPGPAGLEFIGRSNPYAAESDISATARQRILEHFAEDIEFYETYAGKIKTDGEWLPLQQARSAAPGRRRKLFGSIFSK